MRFPRQVSVLASSSTLLLLLLLSSSSRGSQTPPPPPPTLSDASDAIQCDSAVSLAVRNIDAAAHAFVKTMGTYGGGAYELAPAVDGMLSVHATFEEACKTIEQDAPPGRQRTRLEDFRSRHVVDVLRTGMRKSVPAAAALTLQNKMQLDVVHLGHLAKAWLQILEFDHDRFGRAVAAKLHPKFVEAAGRWTTEIAVHIRDAAARFEAEKLPVPALRNASSPVTT